jgi:hypothetical protein
MKDLTIWGSKAVASAPTPRAQVATTGPVSGAMVIHTDGTEPLHPLAETAIKRLIAAPAGSAQSNEDRMYELMNYREACTGKPLCLVVYTLNQLRRFNPRNPFKPSPQDVFEHIAKAERLFRHRVKEWFFPIPMDDPEVDPIAPRWGGSTEGKYRVTSDGVQLIKPGFGSEWGPEPLAEGCFVSRDLVVQWLRADLEKLAKLDGDEFSRHPIAQSEGAGARIPAECWPEGLQARVAKQQRELAAEREAEREAAEYERGLPYEEGAARREAKREHYRRHGYDFSGRAVSSSEIPLPDETALRARTQEIMAECKRREGQYGRQISNLLQPMADIIDNGDQMEAEDDGKAYY